MSIVGDFALQPNPLKLFRVQPMILGQHFILVAVLQFAVSLRFVLIIPF